jgi:hypothetical protein
MAIKLDKPQESAFSPEPLKSAVAQFQLKMTVLMNTYKMMEPKERANHLNEIRKLIERISKILSDVKSLAITNTGVKFSIENSKQSFSTTLARWRKFEALLDSPEGF